MKIEAIHFENHPVLGKFDISFCDSNGQALNTIVLAGINGSGKTNVLTSIIDVFSNQPPVRHPDNFISLTVETALVDRLDPQYQNAIKTFNLKKIMPQQASNLRAYFTNSAQTKSDSSFPKIIYLGTEINYKNLTPSTKPYVYNYQFINKIDESVTQKAAEYFATYIDSRVYSNKSVTPKESIRIACTELNNIFNKLDIDSKLIGLREDGSRMPIFKNSSGNVFNMDGLSSGEKQLFIRIMSLKMVNANNSILLVDEPEISLHPAWQENIIKVYQNIGNNNQVILATHSPQVLSSANNESVRILSRTPDGIKALSSSEVDRVSGLTYERILMDVMGAKNIRSPEMQDKINKLRDFVRTSKYETDEFKILMNEATKIVGEEDQDLVLLKLDIAQRLSKKKKC